MAAAILVGSPEIVGYTKGSSVAHFNNVGSWRQVALSILSEFLVPHSEGIVGIFCRTANMAIQTLPNLVFGTQSAEASAPAVVAPAPNEITLTRQHLQQASQRLADLILSKGKVNGSGFGINGQR